VDGAAVNAHLENVGPQIGKILADGVASLDQIHIHGPADQIELVKPGTKDLGTVYYHVHSGFTNFEASTGGDAAPQTLMTIQPTFSILDRAKAEPIMAEFVEATKRESGCVYYGWTIAGDKLFCREAYVDGAAVNAHLANVGEFIGKILAEGVCKLDHIHIHGPADQLEIVKPGTKDLGTVYYGIHSGFSRYSLKASQQGGGSDV